MTGAFLALRAIDARHAFALATIGCLMFIEGFDLVALALVARDVSGAFHAGPTMLGLALSAAQLGSIGGAASAGRLNERYAMIPLLLSVTAILAGGAALCAIAPDMHWLMAGRVLTGIGLGAAVPLAIGYLSANFPPAINGTVIAIALVGIGLGQIAAGFVTPLLVTLWGWRSLFVIAALATVALAPGLIALPVADRDDGVAQVPNGRISLLLRSGWQRHIALLLPIILCGATVLYFLYSWMPYLSDRMGLSASASAASASLLAAGGLCGVMLIGLLLDRGLPPFALLATTYATAAALLALMAFATLSPSAFLVTCFLLGGAMVGSHNAMTMLIGKVFPKAAHIHVIGISTIMARTAGFAAPVLTGMLIGSGLNQHSLFLIAAILAGCVASALTISGLLPLPNPIMIIAQPRAREV